MCTVKLKFHTTTSDDSPNVRRSMEASCGSPHPSCKQQGNSPRGRFSCAANIMPCVDSNFATHVNLSTHTQNSGDSIPGANQWIAWLYGGVKSGQWSSFCSPFGDTITPCIWSQYGGGFSEGQKKRLDYWAVGLTLCAVVALRPLHRGVATHVCIKCHHPICFGGTEYSSGISLMQRSNYFFLFDARAKFGTRSWLLQPLWLCHFGAHLRRLVAYHAQLFCSWAYDHTLSWKYCLTNTCKNQWKECKVAPIDADGEIQLTFLHFLCWHGDTCHICITFVGFWNHCQYRLCVDKIVGWRTQRKTIRLGLRHLAIWFGRRMWCEKTRWLQNSEQSKS